MKHSEISVH